MTLLAVKDYVATTLGAASAQITANTSYASLDVSRQVPKFEKVGTKLFVIVGGRWRRHEARLTVPRGAGQKRLDYHMGVWLCAGAKDEMVGGDAFDTAFENLSQVLRSATVPGDGQTITDPISGATSRIVSIAEEMDDEGDEPMPAQLQGLVRFWATKEVLIFEDIVA